MMIQPQIDFCCFRLVAINIALTHCYKLVSFLNLIFLLIVSHPGDPAVLFSFTFSHRLSTSSTMSNSIDQLYEVLSRRTSSTLVQSIPLVSISSQQCRTPSTNCMSSPVLSNFISTRLRWHARQQCRTPSATAILSTMSNSIDCPS